MMEPQRRRQLPIFPVASMSKPIGSTIVTALVSAGLADWDDRVADLHPSFEMSDPWVTHEEPVSRLHSAGNTAMD